MEELLKKFDALKKQSIETNQQYTSAEPYPHIVIDDFLPQDIADVLEAEFPQQGSDLWTALPTDDQKNKFASNDIEHFPLKIREVIFYLNSKPFLETLEQITGIENLIADSKMSGGGLHRIERGGKLSVHVDFSHHHENKLNRRLNLLIYLNKDWKEEYGGGFEFWDMAGDGRKKLCSIAPLFNRCVIFSTSPESYHGHPAPLDCPEGMSRKSIALYYFTNGREDGKDQEHNTIFKTSDENQEVSLGTKVVRFGSSDTFRDIMPPALYRFIKNTWNRKD